LACPPGTTKENIAAFCEQKLSPSAFETYMASEHYRIWVAEDEDVLCGYLMSVSGEPEDQEIRAVLRHRPTVEISKIYLLPSAHGSGLAKRLMDIASEDARSQGARSVWLGVNQQNARANRFYDRLGYEIVGTRSFPVGNNLEADYVREKPL
jgi:ribosomal protein S18 acetylase RimI-like enzyme